MPFLRQLHLAVEKYYHLGALSSTYKVYRVGLSRYQSFCTMAQKPPVPASEDTLLLITVHLAMEVISTSNIKVYLLAIRSSHVRSGRHDDLARQLTPRLQQVYQGHSKDSRSSPGLQGSTFPSSPLTLCKAYTQFLHSSPKIIIT